MRYTRDGNELCIFLEGKIDSNNARAVQDEMEALIEGHEVGWVKLDATDLSYISSAGLRTIMHLAKRVDRVSIENVSPEVYDVFHMTGLTEIIEVQRRLREVSVEGLPLIGMGANGRVLRLDDERIIKVYNPVSNTEEKIFREREASRKAFVRGIPTAISFELVRVGESYGIIYEMVDARTLGEVISENPDRLEAYARRMAELLRELHAMRFEEGELSDARLGLSSWIDIAEKGNVYSPDTIGRMRAAVASIPDGDTFVHGDFHVGNIMVTDEDEFLLIDMGDASMGDPVIDLCGTYQIMSLMRRNAQAVRDYTKLSTEQAGQVWNVFIRAYLESDDEDAIRRLEGRLKVFGLIRTLGGLTFSKEVPDDKRTFLAAQAAAAFNEGYEQVMAGGVAD